MSQGIGGHPSKRAALAAKRSSKGLVTIPSQDLRLAVTGYRLGSPIEERDAPFAIMRNNALRKIVEDALEILLISH